MSTPCPLTKKSYKGIEAFLRRIAFNLGNTPSRTEVKIISCIPIDVTDLQQKIVSLEKQLEQEKGKGPETAQGQAIRSLLLNDGSPDASGLYDPCSGQFSLHYSRQSDEYQSQQAYFNLQTCNMPASLSNQACACSSNDFVNNTKDNPKSMFKKLKAKKNKQNKRNNKNPVVYYAQTTHSPFSSYEKSTTENRRRQNRDTASAVYVTEMIRKQFTPVSVLSSLASEFSSPVCRDVEPQRVARDSDACSCFHGVFHNIDLDVGSGNDRNKDTSFYDTSLYDMIPVKEKPTKITNRTKSPRRKTSKNNINPEKKRFRSKIHPSAFNYGRMTTVAYSRRIPTKVQIKKEYSPKTSRRGKNVGARLQPITSGSGCIECGEVYLKRALASTKPPEAVRPIDLTSYKNAECLTIMPNDTECQTTTTQSVQFDRTLLGEDKTEETLNQIKTILQTVLTEVKTNKQKKMEIENKITKDAVVQKGASQSHVAECSSLLPNTYNPYEMNPCLGPYSRQIAPGSALTNPGCFPVFIQTPGRHICSSYYHNSSHIPNAGPLKCAATTSTNTEAKERSKETEKLIKEIYKTMTINMDFPGKDRSSEDNNLFTPVTTNKSLYRPSGCQMSKCVTSKDSRMLQKSSAPPCALRRKVSSNTACTFNNVLLSNTPNMIPSSDTADMIPSSKTTTTFQNKLSPNARTHFTTCSDTERRLRNHRLDTYMELGDTQKKDTQKKDTIQEEWESETTDSDEVSESSETAESVAIHVKEPNKKTQAIQKSAPTKKGLFNKMVRTIKKLRYKKHIQCERYEDEESGENSEYYQTVYSLQTDGSPRRTRTARGPYVMAHPKRRHSCDRNQERRRRSSYMEQEHRRRWNERLTFREPPLKNAYRPAFWQDYEARSAMVSGSPNSNYYKISTQDTSTPRLSTASKGLAWLKKHTIAVKTGSQWKKLVIES